MSTPRELIRKLQNAPGLAKRILPVKDLTSRGHNGAGLTFVPQITKLVLRYDHPRLGAGGSSTGMVAFLTSQLPAVARARPYVEICVQPRNAVPPHILATYASGKKTLVPCAGLSAKEVAAKVAFLCDSMDGEERNVKSGRPVLTAGHQLAERVDPVWDPFTAEHTFRP
ncbi:hypothetical protein DFJ77DRAFT_447253 [Powellomyces hirtus]|nr:hypothetical protein DFJ77DRAFT_447253 [Powellomyces hirtus]